MRTLLAISFFCCTLTGFCQTDTIEVKGVKFLAARKTKVNEEFNDRTDTILSLYRLEGGKKRYLLQHYLYHFAADCNNEFIDKGGYSVTENCFVFTTDYYQKTGHDPIAQKREQVYGVANDGKLTLLSDRTLDHQGKWIETNSY